MSLEKVINHNGHNVKTIACFIELFRCARCVVVV